MDLNMWSKFYYLIDVSNECENAFVTKYPVLKKKMIVIEHIMSPDFVRKLASEKVDHPFVHDERFKIITVARLSHAKGIDQAVKALHVLKKKGYSDIAWTVVGYGVNDGLVLGDIAQ